MLFFYSHCVSATINILIDIHYMSCGNSKRWTRSYMTNLQQRLGLVEIMT